MIFLPRSCLSNVVRSSESALPNLQFGSLIGGFSIRHYTNLDYKSYDKDSTMQLSNSKKLSELSYLGFNDCKIIFKILSSFNSYIQIQTKSRSSEFAIRKPYPRICNPTPTTIRITNPSIWIRQCNCRIARIQLILIQTTLILLILTQTILILLIL